ncbi:hypothetical protein V5O48_018290 [Marasmius crinis-equi]|uniref:Uncharacterized protein n=1 Tax=Marasmius crinis-equi TaxID=585013 RepID=A0ABR3ELL5_9AGAR
MQGPLIMPANFMATTVPTVPEHLADLHKEVYCSPQDWVLPANIPARRIMCLACICVNAPDSNAFAVLLFQHFILSQHSSSYARCLAQLNPAQAFLYKPTSLLYKKVFPPFNSAYLQLSLTNKVTYLLDNAWHENKEAYVALYLQYFILSNYKDLFFADQVARLDPKQYFIYLGHSNPNDLIDADWFSTHVQEHANVIAKIRILSVEVACLPGAPQAWCNAVFGARAVFTPCEARAAYLFIYSLCQSIPIIPIPPTQSGHEDDSEGSANYTALKLSPYVDSLNLSAESS